MLQTLRSIISIVLTVLFIVDAVLVQMLRNQAVAT